MYNPPKAWEHVLPIERAAHVFGSYYPDHAVKICTEEGITEEEIEQGAKLAEERYFARQINCAVVGSPEYGIK